MDKTATLEGTNIAAALASMPRHVVSDTYSWRLRSGRLPVVPARNWLCMDPSALAYYSPARPAPRDILGPASILEAFRCARPHVDARHCPLGQALRPVVPVNGSLRTWLTYPQSPPQ